MLDEILHFISGATLAITVFTTLRFRSKRPGPQRFDKTLLLAILWCLTLNGLHPMITRAIIGPVSTFSHFFEPIQFLIAPLLSAYIRSLEGPVKLLKPRNVLHLLPFFIIIALVLILFATKTASDFFAYAIWLSLSLQSAAYLVFNLKKIHQLRRNLDSVVSSLSHFDPRWLNTFSIILVALHVLSISFFIALAHGASPELIMILMSSSLLIAVWVLAFGGMEQRQIPQSGLPPRSSGPSEQADITGEDRLEAQKVKSTIEAKKLYLNPELGLDDVALALGLPRNRVSFLINTVLGSSFYDLINGLRYEAFLQLIDDPDRANDKILTLAFDAGFNSKPTFNKIIMARSGSTPSALRLAKKESRSTH